MTRERGERAKKSGIGDIRDSSGGARAGRKFMELKVMVQFIVLYLPGKKSLRVVKKKLRNCVSKR